jgi:uncharacterized YigZ family protein
MSASPVDSSSYLVPSSSSEAELREKGSRFLAFVRPAGGVGEAKAEIEALRRRFPDATHHCWAWRLGPEPRERSADDGEPAGTAGMPMLQVLRGAGLADVVAVVVRWFGGTKLGKGGLARAYAGAVREALAGLPVERRVPTVHLAVRLPYEKLGALKRLLHPPAVELAAEVYGEVAELTLSVSMSERARLEEALAELGLEAREPRPPRT